mmetsp:Transcript_138183/g.240409  ORF Transcript_138183/g.240409 Transcript_138183/m.240409 type:complete len:762 (-) Transcript_138183:85-2370(-)
MKRKEPEAPSGAWQFEVGHGHWKDFGDEDAALLESLSSAHPAGKVTTKAFSFGKGSIYDVDFSTGTQTNTATGKVRKIRHSTPPGGGSSAGRAPPPPVSAAAEEATAETAAKILPRESPADTKSGREPVVAAAPAAEGEKAGLDTTATRAPPAKKIEARGDAAPPPMPPPEEPPPETAAAAASSATAPADGDGLTGATSKVAAAEADRTLKRKEPEAPSREWQFEVGHGHWKAFGGEDAALLQSLEPLGKASTKAFSFGKGSIYELDFEAGKQINTVTGKIRKIRCMPITGRTPPSVASPAAGAAGAAPTAKEEKPPVGTAAASKPAETSASIKRKSSSDDVDFAGAISTATPSTAPVAEEPPAVEAHEPVTSTTAASEKAAASETLAKASATSTGKPEAKKKSAWSTDSKIPDGPPMSVEDIKKQASLGAQSKRGWKSVSFGPMISKNEHARHCFEKMLENEKRNCGEWAVFYHSYSHAALIYEVQAAIAAVLFRFKSTYAPLPRLMRGCFSEIPDAPSMMKEFPTWPEQDHSPRFKCVGICATTSLLGADPEAPPTAVFLSGYAASAIPITVVEGLLTDCGIDTTLAKKLTRQIMDLAGKYGLDVAAFGGKSSKSGLSGHLLQIFMKRNLVDKYAYASHPMGVPDKRRHPIGDHLKTCGLSPPGHIVGQVRIVVHPSAFLQAGKVRMFVYSADEDFHKSRSDFQELVTALLSPVLGSEDARARAAKAIFGGALPSWFHAGDQRETAKTATKKLGEEDWK